MLEGNVRSVAFALLAVAAGACAREPCPAGTQPVNGGCLYEASPCDLCGYGTECVDGGCRLISPCGPGTAWSVDAGICVTIADAGTPPPAGTRGARWTNVHWVAPAGAAPIANMQLPEYLAAGIAPYIVILGVETTAAGEVWLHGGTGAKQSADPLVYSFADGFLVDGAPGAVPIAVAEDGTFATTPGVHSFDWTLPFFLGAPDLLVRAVAVTGRLDGSGLPTSPQLTGTYTGCISQASAAATRVPILDWSPTVDEILQRSGAVLDCSADTPGALDGYALEIQWEAQEVVALEWAAP